MTDTAPETWWTLVLLLFLAAGAAGLLATVGIALLVSGRVDPQREHTRRFAQKLVAALDHEPSWRRPVVWIGVGLAALAWIAATVLERVVGAYRTPQPPRGDGAR